MGCDCLKSLFDQSALTDGTNYTYEIEQLSSDRLLDEETTSTQSNASKATAPPDVNARLEDFVQLKTLGKGSFAKVTLVELKTNKKIFAMKILKKKALRKQKQIGHTKTERIGVNNRVIAKLISTERHITDGVLPLVIIRLIGTHKKLLVGIVYHVLGKSRYRLKG